MTPIAVSALALIAVLLLMLGELFLSRAHEQKVVARGGYEVTDEVYRTMRWAYPGAFIAMAIEGALFGPMPGNMTIFGIVLMCASKALKYWAIATLGMRWTYRVFVLPDTPLVQSGPYSLMRHPNYVAVIGELVAMALITGARITGPLGVLFFAALLRKRIRAEEAALGLH